jgi:hypothetical protein
MNGIGYFKMNEAHLKTIVNLSVASKYHGLNSTKYHL